MTKTKQSLIIISGIILMISGAILFEYTYNALQVLIEKLEEHGLRPQDVGYLQILKVFHLHLFFGMFAFVSGLLLLLKKKAGWLLSVLVAFLLPFLTVSTEFSKGFYHGITGRIAIMFGVSIILLSILALLLSKPVRSVYGQKNATFVSAAVACVVLSIYVLVINYLIY